MTYDIVIHLMDKDGKPQASCAMHKCLSHEVELGQLCFRQE